MASISLEEECSDHDTCASYRLSADVSESESSSTFSALRFSAEAASSSMASSPLAPPAFAGISCFPVVGGKNVSVWEHKTETPEADFSGKDHQFTHLMLYTIIYVYIKICN